MKKKKLICEVCKKNEAVGVACVPGIPYSAAYCKDCLKADAHPLGIVMANTICCGGLDQCAAWWKEIVEHTLKHLNKSLDWFNSEVEKELKKENVLEKKQ